MDLHNIRSLNPGFHKYFGLATIRKWIEGGTILKVGENNMSEADKYHRARRAL